MVFLSTETPRCFNLAENLATLRTLNGSSLNASETCLKILFFKSFWPSKGSMRSPSLVLAIALIVKSLLFKSSSKVTLVSVLNEKPLCPVPDFLSVLAKAYSSLVSG